MMARHHLGCSRQVGTRRVFLSSRAFFESLATFYRNTYINWIEGAKRPTTRAARIGEMIELLKAGRKQK